MIRLGVKPDGTDITYPIYIYALLTESSSSHTLYHNTVYVGGAGVTGGTNPTYAFWRYNIATDDFRNNIFINNRSNAAGNTAKHYAVVLTGTTSLTMNYNIYNALGTGGIFANNGSSDVAYSSGWVTGDVNSYTSDPGLINPTGNATSVNLHLTAPNLKGVATATTGITDDIDGDKRSTPPEIGADEFPYDAGITAIDAPTTASFCGQSKAIIVHFKNYGLLPLTSVTINITVNGVYSYNYIWSGTLAVGATTAAINLGNYNFSGGAYKLSVSTSLNNGQADNNANNDTTSVSFNVTPTAFPTIAVSTVNNTVCINTPVSFKAVYASGGTAPILQWKVNSTNVGTSDTVFTSSTLANGDTVSCVLTSNAPCATPAVVTSNIIKMIVGVTLPPSVTIATVDTNICAGATSSFKATIVNGGLTPHYKWIKNGVVVGTDSIAFKFLTPANKDSVRCIMSSSLSCASKAADTSKYITITVNPLLTPTVSITSTATNFCAGVADTFAASITNGGSFPVYQWRLNAGQFVGSNSNKFITTTLNNNDSVYVIITSSATCLASTIATSSKIGVKVTPVVTPFVSISATKNAICAGESVNFIASPANGGTSPTRTWYKNKVVVASNTDTLNLSGLQNLDSVYYILVSSAPCIATSPTYTSNVQRINVSQFVTPRITASASTTAICNGASIKFSALPSNGGPAPHYAWRKNGVIVGTDDTVFTTSILNNKDSISVVLIANNFCQTKSSDTSSSIGISVTPTVTPTISVATASNPICELTPTLFSSTFTNGGTTPHFTWMKNGVTIGTDSSALVTSAVAHRDTVYVILNSSANCKTANNIVSNKLIMLVSPAVNAGVTISESANPICKGKPVIFSSSLVNAGGAPHFQWMRNGNKVGTDIANYTTDSVANADSFYVMMTSSVMCATPAIAMSNKIGMRVNINETPKVTVTASSNTICSGEVVKFTATDSAALSNKLHQWYKNGLKVGTDSVNYTVLLAPGDKVMCILKASGSCVTKIADTSSVTVTVNPMPTKPVITRIQDTLKSSVSPSYQWYLNNALISGETNRTLHVTQNGSYKVTAELVGCKATSDTFGFYFVAVHEVIGSDFISVHPNPTNRLIYIDADFASNEETEITVTDISGKELLHYTKEKSTSLKNEAINLDELNQGVYLIHVRHGGSSSVSKVIKE